MGEIEDRIKAVQAESETTRDDPYPQGTAFTRPGRAGSIVQSVRLPAETFDEIERLARERDVPVSAFIRGLIMDGLSQVSRTDAAVSVADLQRFIAERAHSIGA